MLSFLTTSSAWFRRLSTVAAGLVLAATATAQSIATTPASMVKKPTAALASFIDRLPELLDIGLPSFAPPGAVTLYVHPRLSDLIHEDYFRFPVGARIKLDQELELQTELGTYFSHGFGDHVGNGLYQARVGLKTERVITADSGWSTGIDFVTPLSRPPRDITDGVRHTRPFVSFTRTVKSQWGLVGFATLGADLIDHTSLRPNFYENQLHENALFLTVGVAREWRRMHLIFQVFDGNTAPLSDRSDNVFGFRPSVGISLMRRNDGTPRATATFEGRTIWGPDGFETGIATRVRVDLRYRPGRAK